MSQKAIDHDQLIHDIEQRHISLRKEHEIIKLERDTLAAKLTQQQNEGEELRETILSLSSQISAKDLECKIKENKCKEFEDQVNHLNDRNARLLEECDRYKLFNHLISYCLTNLLL